MDLAQIKELLRIVAESGVAEVEIEEDEFKLVVRKNPPSVMVQPPMFPNYGMSYPMGGYPQPAPPPQAAPAAPSNPVPAATVPGNEVPPREEKSDNEVVVKAPIVGTFYRSPGPDENPFVQVGDSVGQGEVLCIIEAMKLMNEIESDVGGVVKKILADDAQPVEYDQPLFIIEAA